MSQAITSNPVFSWRTHVLALFRVGTFPRYWLPAATGVLTSSLGIIALCIWMGVSFHGKADYYFGEKLLATYWSVGLLAASGIVCFLIRRGSPAVMRGFWLFSGLLLCFTALDDLGRIHEQVDRLIHKILGWDPNDRTTDHLDDVLVLSYLVPAAWLWFTHRREVIQMRLMVQMFAIAILFFLGMVAVDMLVVIEWLEEGLKIIAGALILCGFLAAYFSQEAVNS